MKGNEVMGKEVTFKAKSVKKMDNPLKDASKADSKKYICYVKLQDVPAEFANWMGTNPRDQKLTTAVAKDIERSIESGVSNFHEINRGIVMSVDAFAFNNKTDEVTVTLSDPCIHGNIDGGHTLKIILNAQKKNTLVFEQYVYFEFFTGIKDPAQLAEARNSSVQVDRRSIEELNKSFDFVKMALKDTGFYNRIAFKQNEHHGERNIIDIREIIAIMNMFNHLITPPNSDTQPITSYTGKELSLNKFLNLKASRDQVVKNMTPILPDIYKLWDTIELTFPEKGKNANRIYKRKKYAKYVDDSTPVGNSLFSNKPMTYCVPKGLMYPIVGAFRALVNIDPSSQKYSWKVDPQIAWEDLGGKLINIIITSSEDLSDTPDVVGKSSNTWDLLYKEVLIYSMLHSSKGNG